MGFLVRIEGVGIVNHLTVKKSDYSVGILISKVRVMSNHNNKLFFGYFLEDIHNLHTRLAVESTCGLIGK